MFLKISINPESSLRPVCPCFVIFILYCLIVFETIVIGIVFLILFSDCALLVLYTVDFLNLLILFLATLLNLLISYSRFLKKYMYDFPHIGSYCLSIKTILLSFFPVCMPLIFYSYIIALTRSSSTMFDRSFESEHSYLFLFLGRKHSIFYHYDVSDKFSCSFFFMLDLQCYTYTTK